MTMHAPSHPGRLVAADLEALGLSVADGAKALGVTRSQLYRVIKGESAISPEMALRLEAVLGTTADHWLRMQAAFDLAKLRRAPDGPAKGLKRLHAA